MKNKEEFAEQLLSQDTGPDLPHHCSLTLMLGRLRRMREHLARSAPGLCIELREAELILEKAKDTLIKREK